MLVIFPLSLVARRWRSTAGRRSVAGHNSGPAMHLDATARRVADALTTFGFTLSNVTIANSTSDPTTAPEDFQRAVASLSSVTVRPEVTLEPIRAPQRLAPYSYALGAEVLLDPASDVPEASGRLVLLHDPDGDEAWDGTLRLVSYVSAALEPDMAGDPLLADAAWSWLTESLEEADAPYVALGGTVTQTSSTRYGDLSGPASTTDLEIRASWTATKPELAGHLKAWVNLLASAAGAPPPGVSLIAQRDAPE